MSRYEDFVEGYIFGAPKREIDPDFKWKENEPVFSIKEISNILRYLGESINQKRVVYKYV